MGEPLSSSLFTAESIDAVTRKRLQDCADGGNESATHIAHGARGEHVRRVQEALRRLREADSSLGTDPKTGKLVPLAVNGTYDEAFARAVFVYKQRRDIRNFRNQIDDIVGKKTIQQIDKDLPRKLSPVDPGEVVVPPDTPPFPPQSSRHIVHREFQTVKPEGSQGGPSDVGNIKDIFDLLTDTFAAEAFAAANEVREARRFADVPDGFRVNRFQMDVALSFDALASGQIAITDTTMDYDWGPAQLSVIMRKKSHAVIFGEDKPQSRTDTTELVPRARAEATPFVVPPKA